MKKVFLILTMLLVVKLMYSQVPEMFNYQGVLRNLSGDIIKSTNISLQISLLEGSSTSPASYMEDHNVQTNSSGQFAIQIGGGSNPTGSFSSIDWSFGQVYLKVSVDETGGTSYQDLPVVQLLTVPYAMYAKSSKTAIYADSTDVAKDLDKDVLYFTDSDTLFAVKDREGNIVFAVFPDGAAVYVNQTAKGKLGGFAVSGRTPSKAGEVDILKVTLDSTRIYVSDTINSKGKLGGFAVSGRTPSKTTGINDYLVITPDSARIYVNDTLASKGKLGGFAVSGRTPSKNGAVNDYLTVTRDSTRVYITESGAKGKLGGFAVSGRTPSKGIETDYFNISGNSDVETVNSEARIFWYPKKEAFLTGRVLVENPDSVGTNSMATGFESKAMGDYSQAMGYQSKAKGDYSTAIGMNAYADSASFAFGNMAVASGIKSYALGAYAKAEGEGSFALGSRYYSGTQNTEALGDYSYALGLGAVADTLMAVSIGTITKAKGISSVAMGNNSDAIGNFSVAMGYGNIAEGGSSVAMGFNSEAEGSHSVTIGDQVIARASESTVMGYKNVSKSDYSLVTGRYNDTLLTNTLFEIGYGSTSNRRNLLTFYNDARLQISNTGDASLIIDADTDNSGEEDNPRILLRQDAASIYGSIGMVGTAGEIFANSGTNAMYLMNHSPSSLHLGTNDLPHLTISSAGNVGIGTVSPAFKLDVNGSLSADYYYGAENNDYLQIDVNENFRFISNSTEKMRIDGAGNVGIGTTTPADKLDVNGNLRVHKYFTLMDYDGGADYCQLISRDDNLLVWGDGLVIGNYNDGDLWDLPEGFLKVKTQIYAGTNNNYGGTINIGNHGDIAGSAPYIGLHEISPNYSWYFGVDGENLWIRESSTSSSYERMTFEKGGYVGINNTNPAYTLDVTGNINASSYIYGSVYYVKGRMQFGSPSDGEIDDYRLAKSGTKMYLIYFPSPSGVKYPLTIEGASNYVGIGTTSPAYPLHVEGYKTPSSYSYGYLNSSGSTGSTTNTGAVSIFAQYRVRAQEFNADSDERIKNVIGKSDAGKDLDLIRNIKITDYQYVDTISKGSEIYKKVIAQELQKVYPNAVTVTSGFIPSIYCKAKSIQYDETSGQMKIETFKKHQLELGDQVKLIHKEGVFTTSVVEVIADHVFMISSEKDYSELFVFGKEVHDFLTVDYEAISMLNVSATQELIRKDEEQLIRISKLEKENQELKQKLNEIIQLLEKK